MLELKAKDHVFAGEDATVVLTLLSEVVGEWETLRTGEAQAYIALRHLLLPRQRKI